MDLGSIIFLITVVFFLAGLYFHARVIFLVLEIRRTPSGSDFSIFSFFSEESTESLNLLPTVVKSGKKFIIFEAICFFMVFLLAVVFNLLY